MTENDAIVGILDNLAKLRTSDRNGNFCWNLADQNLWIVLTTNINCNIPARFKVYRRGEYSRAGAGIELEAAKKKTISGYAVIEYLIDKYPDLATKLAKPV